MIGAALGRRAGLRPAATALLVALVAGTGCASPVAHHAPAHGRSLARAAAMVPKPPAVSLPRVRAGLPWPVTLRTADGTFVIGRSGAIHWLRPALQRTRAPAVYPMGFVWVNRSAGTWAMMRDGHLVIMRDRAMIWQSAGRYPVQDAAHMNQILTGRPGVAFEVGESGPWFMAGWHGAEHLVAAVGWPEMWTLSGNLIGVLHRPGGSFGYAVFSPAGTRLATLATGLNVWVADQRDDDLGTGTFWYLTGSRDLVRTDGVTTRVIANARALGFTRVPFVGILGHGLIQLLSAYWRKGQVILYPDGRMFARIPAPPRGEVGGFGALSVSPGHRMVAYVLTNEPGNGSTVVLVRPGSAPVAVYQTAHGSSPCAAPPLAWHGSWLLYTPPPGQAVLIDTAGSHRIIRLPSTLPGSDGRTVRVQAVSWR